MANDTTAPGDGDPPEPDPTLPFRARLALDGVVGRSPALARTFEEMAEAATTNVPVHFVGGRGTGKTSLARALGAAGPRPFVEVNVADVPPFAVEAELFGTRREGFGSAPSVPGAMRSAEGGTLFLDEVGALEAGVQVKLLRALPLEEYRRVGSFMPERASFRLLTATSADLEAAARAGTFHPELYQQLSRRIIRVPSLGERRSDVPALVEALLDRAAADSQLPGSPAAPRCWRTSRRGSGPATLASWPARLGGPCRPPGPRAPLTSRESTWG